MRSYPVKFQRTLLTILFLIPIMLHAQFFISGQDPASVRWKQINNSRFKVIFSEEYKKQAMHLLNILDTVYYLDTQTLQASPKKISLLLHNQTATSNAFAGWAPKRMEFYTTPAQDNYPQRWLAQLGLHEFRHVVQLSKLNQGMTRGLNYLFGQQATAAVAGTFVPFWFIEGDAVCAETALSHSGRGRVPDFIMPLRTQVLEKGIYSYDKAVLGSYKDFIPDHYTLGYNLVALGRAKYGTEIWEHTINNVARRPYSIIPFNNGIKKKTGLSKTGFYRWVMDSLNTSWNNQKASTGITDKYTLPIKETFHYTNYRFPTLMDDGNIIALQSGIDDITRIVTIDEQGNVTRLFTPGRIIADALSYNRGMICWAEYQNDLRWGNKSYSVIKVYDIHNKKLRQLTRKSQLFAPQISPDGKSVLASKVSPDGSYSLVIYDLSTGRLLNEISSPDNLFFQKPAWGKNSREVISVVLGDYGKKIVSVDTEASLIHDLIPWTWHEISNAIIANDTVFFIGSFSGISDIYAFSIHDKKIFRVVSSKFGTADLQYSVSRNSFVYSEYSSEGYRVSLSANDTNAWMPLEEVQDFSPKLYEIISRQVKGILSNEMISNRQYDITRYSRIKNLFNFHSWGPLYLDVSDETVNPGVIFMSQNILSTMITTAGYEYNMNEESGKYKVGISYSGWYPVIDITADYGRRKDLYAVDTLVQWHETNITTGIKLPLSLTRNKYFRGIQPELSFTQKYIDRDNSAEFTFRPQSFRSLDYRTYFYNQLKKSQRDIYPKWGQIVDLNFRHAVLEKNRNDRIISGEVYLFFPGFFRHHSIRFYGGWQQRTARSFYGSMLSNPRGYDHIFDNDLQSYKVDYVLPLCYPDLSIGSLAYIKRLKLDLFYDYARGEGSGKPHTYNTFGLEFTADMHILRFIAPFDLGTRIIYNPDQMRTDIELLFSIDFRALY